MASKKKTKSSKPKVTPKYKPKTKPKSKRKSKPKNITLIETGSIGFPEKGNDRAREQYMNSSHANNKRIDMQTIEGISSASTALEKQFLAIIKKTPFEPDEVQIFRHGVVIRPKSGQYNDSVINKIAKLAEGLSVHVVKEDNTFSVRVNLGNSKIGSDIDKVVDNIEENVSTLERIRRYLEDEYGDTDWFSFWDTEEALYD